MKGREKSRTGQQCSLNGSPRKPYGNFWRWNNPQNYVHLSERVRGLFPHIGQSLEISFCGKGAWIWVRCFSSARTSLRKADSCECAHGWSKRYFCPKEEYGQYITVSTTGDITIEVSSWKLMQGFSAQKKNLGWQRIWRFIRLKEC